MATMSCRKFYDCYKFPLIGILFLPNLTCLIVLLQTRPSSVIIIIRGCWKINGFVHQVLNRNFPCAVLVKPLNFLSTLFCVRQEKKKPASPQKLHIKSEAKERWTSRRSKRRWWWGFELCLLKQHTDQRYRKYKSNGTNFADHIDLQQLYFRNYKLVATVFSSPPSCLLSPAESASISYFDHQHQQRIIRYNSPLALANLIEAIISPGSGDLGLFCGTSFQWFRSPFLCRNISSHSKDIFASGLWFAAWPL